MDIQNILPIFLIVVLIVLLFQILILTIKKKEFNYIKNENIFTESEKIFFKSLQEALNNRFYIFAKVRVADVLCVAPTVNRNLWWKAFNKINAKHFDYVLCNPSDFSILAAIELDDNSHNKAHRKNRDDFLDTACHGAGLPLVRFQVQKQYSLEIIQRKIHESVGLFVEKQKSTEVTEKNIKVGVKNQNENSVPFCPKCSAPMVRRTVKSGSQSGKQFWGCSMFPDCRGVRKIQSQ